MWAMMRQRRRRGAALVEVALICPLAFLLVFGLIVGAIAVFRLHQVTALANEGARWASVHGPTYAKETGTPLPTKEVVFEKAMRPLGTSLAPEDLSYDVTWNADRTQVGVSVSYQWITHVWGMEFTLNGYSELPVSY